MGWKDKMKEFVGGDLTFLSVDGEVISFVVVGEPVLLEGKFKGKPSEKIGCPIVTEDGFTLFAAGKRLTRKLAKYEDRFGDTAFMAIRHGEQNEITASYELKISPDKELTTKLLQSVQGKDYTTEINEAVQAALEVMRQ